MSRLLTKDGRIVVAAGRASVIGPDSECGCCGEVQCAIPACCSGSNCFVNDPLLPITVEMRVRANLTMTAVGFPVFNGTYDQVFVRTIPAIGGSNKCATINNVEPLDPLGCAHIQGSVSYSTAFGIQRVATYARWTITRNTAVLTGGPVVGFGPSGPCGPGWEFSLTNQWNGTRTTTPLCCLGTFSGSNIQNIAAFTDDTVIGNTVLFSAITLDTRVLNRCRCSTGTTCPQESFSALRESGCSGCGGGHGTGVVI